MTRRFRTCNFPPTREKKNSGQTFCQTMEEIKKVYLKSKTAKRIQKEIWRKVGQIFQQNSNNSGKERDLEERQGKIK